MKFKIDENLPFEVVKLLEDNGHDAMSVLEQNLSGAPDTCVAEVCQKEKRALVTLDMDFSDIRTYSPDEFFGLIVLRLKRQDKPHVLSAVAQFLQKNPSCDMVHGNIHYADADGNILYEQKPDFRSGIVWKKMPFHHPTCFVGKSSYERLGLFDTTYKVAMDYELVLRYFCKGAKFGYR